MKEKQTIKLNKTWWSQYFKYDLYSV